MFFDTPKKLFSILLSYLNNEVRDLSFLDNFFNNLNILCKQNEYQILVSFYISNKPFTLDEFPEVYEAELQCIYGMKIEKLEELKKQLGKFFAPIDEFDKSKLWYRDIKILLRTPPPSFEIEHEYRIIVNLKRKDLITVK